MVKEIPPIIIEDDYVPSMSFQHQIMQWWCARVGDRIMDGVYYELGLELAKLLWPEEKFKNWQAVLDFVHQE